MELKRILASDARSAIDSATAQYGQDVLVISNHRVNGQTELVVAVDLDDQLQPESPARPMTASSDFGSQLARIGAQPKSTPESNGHQQGAANGADHREYIRSREIVDLVRDELAALRREFRLSQQTSGWELGLSVSPAVQPLVSALTEAGVPAGLRTLLLDSIKDMGSEQDALQAIREQLGHALARPEALPPQTGVHLIAGPSGAGKTLMTARLASHAVSRLGARQVAVITYQDLRLGAWSQTQMLCAQTGIECFRADDAATLRLLLGELSHRSLVLIDTPGVQMGSRIAEVLALCPAAACHAIVPADASQATLNRVLRAPGVRWQSLMVSKLDESTQPWPLLQFLCDNSLPLSASSDGSNTIDLKCDLTAEALVEMAIAHLPLLPADEAPAGKHLKIEISQSQRVFAPSSPRGLRGPFN